MSLAFKGIYNCLKHGHDNVFLVTFLGYLIVGSGSFAFHATLKCEFALEDIGSCSGANRTKKIRCNSSTNYP
jgi:hypothetical protein